MARQSTLGEMEKQVVKTVSILRLAAWAGLVILALGTQAALAEPLVYVPLGGEGKIVVVDAAKDEVVDTISGVTAFGIFVLLDEYYVDGLVHVNSLMDDYYVLREDKYSLIGERTGRSFRLGDPVHVRVSRVDRLERKIDFVLAPFSQHPS